MSSSHKFIIHEVIFLKNARVFKIEARYLKYFRECKVNRYCQTANYFWLVWLCFSIISFSFFNALFLRHLIALQVMPRDLP